MVTEDWTLSGEHIMGSTDDLLPSCTPESYIMLLTNIAPINITF